MERELTYTEQTYELQGVIEVLKLCIKLLSKCDDNFYNTTVICIISYLINYVERVQHRGR